MQLALDACRAAEKPNFTAIARDFPSVNRQTLKRRFDGQQSSRASAISTYCKSLTTIEEEELINHVNMLMNHGLPPHLQWFRILQRKWLANL
jgi:hypothetical protein